MHSHPNPRRPSFDLRSTEDTPVEDRCRLVCPVCAGSLVEIRAKLQCSRCHTICETCCEGGRG